MYTYIYIFTVYIYRYAGIIFFYFLTEKKQISTRALKEFYKKYELEIKPYRTKPFVEDSEADSDDEPEVKNRPKTAPNKGTQKLDTTKGKPVPGKPKEKKPEPIKEDHEEEKFDHKDVYEFPILKTTHSHHSHTSHGSKTNAHHNDKTDNRKDNVQNYISNMNKDHQKTHNKKILIDNNWSANENPFLNQGALKKVLKEEFPSLISEKPAPQPSRKI